MGYGFLEQQIGSAANLKPAREEIICLPTLADSRCAPVAVEGVLVWQWLAARHGHTSDDRDRMPPAISNHELIYSPQNRERSWAVLSDNGLGL